MKATVSQSFMKEPGLGKVRSLVRKALEQFSADADERGLYVSLVDIGQQRAMTVSLAAYGDVLAQEGFSAPRVSEVRRILSDAATASEFVKGGLTVLDALEMAREAFRLKSGKRNPRAVARPEQTPAEACISKTLDGLALVFQRCAAAQVSADTGFPPGVSIERIGMYVFRYTKGPLTSLPRESV